MKLVGSKLEKEIEDGLRNSQNNILNNLERSEILQLLQNTYGEICSALVLSHTPSQDEHFYCILVNGIHISSFEFPRSKSTRQFPAIKIPTDSTIQYKKRLRGKVDNLSFLIAIKIAEDTLK